MTLQTADEPLVYRSKVECLRVCTTGPIAVVYPEGVWYHSCTAEVIEKIIQRHLIKGEVVSEYAFAHNPFFDRGFDTQGGRERRRKRPAAVIHDYRACIDGDRFGLAVFNSQSSAYRAAWISVVSIK
jgi:(2Fe-2S) ferredoxin